MNRNARICLVVLLGFATSLVACPPTPLPWSIIDPVATPVQSYGANIACDGDATTSANYTVKIVADGSSLQTQGGTSTQCAWSTTVQEPSGGWPLNGQNFRTASLELWTGGNMQAAVTIDLN